MTVVEHWHDLVTASLLGTDRRDPPEPPAGPLSEVVDDALEPTPSSRMLTAVAACVAARRAGMRPRPPVPRLLPPEVDDRPPVPPAAARRWWSIIATWPVLEDEWLSLAERGGWRLPADVLVGLLRRHRNDTTRRARVIRLGGPVAPWLLEHQPALRSSTDRPRPSDIPDELPALAVPPQLAGLLDAGSEAVVPAVVGGLRDATFGTTHRAVLVNFVARARGDVLGPLAEGLATADVPGVVAGMSSSLAELATTRRQMGEELTP